MKCAVPGCCSYDDLFRGKSFHRFPFENKEMCALWLIAIRNPTLQSFTDARQAYNNYVCSAHFLKTDYKPLQKRRVLKNSAVPSVFTDREHISVTASQDVASSPQGPILPPTTTQAPQGFTKPQLQSISEEFPFCIPKLQLYSPVIRKAPTQSRLHKSLSGSYYGITPVRLFSSWHQEISGSETAHVPALASSSSHAENAIPCQSISGTYYGVSKAHQEKVYTSNSLEMSANAMELEEPESMLDDETLPESTPAVVNIKTKISTPKQFRPYRPLRPPKSRASPGVVSLDTSFSSMDLGNDSGDVTYDPSSSSSSQAGSEASSAPREDTPEWKGKKWIVDESQLMALFCTCPVCAGILDKKIATVGSRIKVTWNCHNGHDGVWSSCPSIRGMPQNNVLLASSVIFNGANFQQLEDIAVLMNLQIPCKSTMNIIQSSYLLPAIDDEYNQQKENVIRHLEGHKVHLCGDGRSDSPGHSAKYTTYSFMDDATDNIVHFELVQVSETTSSVAMEALGLKRGLDHLIGIGVDIEVLTTDRSPSIKKMLREQYAAIKHEFDTWHTSKSVKKKLVSQSNRKPTRELQPWIRSITNHLWFSCASCVQDAEELKRTWKSLLNHVLGVHSWTENGQVHRCRHDPITEEQHNRKRWLTKDSEAYKVLCSIVLCKNLLKDLSQMALFKHTGQLEVFHSMMLKYASKKNHYMYPQMRARTQLAVLDHNANTGRKQKLDSDGEKRNNVVYQKLSKSFVLKKVYEEKSYNFRDDLVGRALQRRRDESVDCRDASSRLVTKDLPKNVARCEKPEKAELETGYRSRYF